MTAKETFFVGWFALLGMISSLMLIFQVQPVHSLDPSYPCVDGYTGKQCHLQCPYPQYGYRCRRICSCSPLSCHYINGCPPPAEKCPVGYFGRNCEFGCLYPSYGLGCQRTCACSRKRCNISNGCQYTKIGTSNQNIDKNKHLGTERQKTLYYTSTHSFRLASRRSISDIGPASLMTNLNITLIKPTPTTGIPIHTSLTSSIKTAQLKKQSQLSRENESIKGIAKKLAEDSAFKDIPESSKNKWIEISIISVGVLAGVLLMAHLLVSFMQRNTVLETRNSRNY